MEGQKRKTRTGIIKVLGLSHKREKQCDLRLAWEMFHKIHHMYSDIKNKEEINMALLLTSMSDHKDINKVREIRGQYGETEEKYENRNNKGFSINPQEGKAM